MKLRKTQIPFLNNMLVDLPAHTSLTHFWNMGSLLGFCLGLQILTGIFLAMHYSSDISTAFNCLSHIMRDVEYGWFLRLLHSNGASLFFFMLYIHLGRGLYFKSFFLPYTWTVGVIIFLVSMLTAFMGYVLPWGQMSYWGATVITNLLSAVPYLGQFLVEWMWGGFSVNNATLTRFFSIHYIFPFVIAVMVMMHLIFLHEEKSSNPLGLNSTMDKIPFYPYFSSKDLMSISLVIFLFLMIMLIYPFKLMDPENFIPANPLSTPAHIQPEWYFLFAYAILRAIPNKLGGVVGLVMSILVLLPLSLKSLFIQNNKVSFMSWLFWMFLFSFLILTWLGMMPVEDPFPLISKFMTVIYFVLILAMIML